MGKQHDSQLKQKLINNCESRLRLFLEYSADAFYLHDLNGDILDVNQTACLQLGYSRAELLISNVSDIEMLTSGPDLMAEWRALNPDKPHLWHGLHQRKDGSHFHVEGHNQRFEVEGHSLILALVRDITERKQAEEKLKLAASVFENTTEGVIVTDAGVNIIAINQAMTEISGYSEKEALGENPNIWNSGRHNHNFFQNMWNSLLKTGQWRGEIWNRRKNGEAFPCWQTISAISDDSGNISHYVSILSDITSIKESQAKIEYLAHHDSLTDLPNRLLFNARLEHALEMAHRDKQQIGLIFLDLDNFKRINDSLGHPIGDGILQSVAKRMKSLIRGADTLARLGGDEFTLILEEIERPQEISKVAQKVLDTFNDAFEVEGHQLHVTPSMGISIYPRDGQDAASLIRNADTAMYLAKERGRNTYQFYASEFTARASERIRMETELRRAIKRNELQIYYQPQFASQTGRLVGAEALVRWQHPAMGLLSPVDFLALAEETGLIVTIGEWVLQTSCAQIKAWREQGFDLEYISVNISGKQLQHNNFPEMVRQVIKETGCNAQWLELEVSEELITQQAKHSVSFLQGLREMGISIAIDDFGTGHSSLSYLKRLPLTKLKIDRSFVRDIPADSSDTVIAKAIVALGKSLQLKVCAEGVETTEQQQFLKAEGCDEEQGFLYSRPIPLEAFSELMKHHFTDTESPTIQ